MTMLAITPINQNGTASFYDVRPGCSTQQDYIELCSTIIMELSRNGTNVRSICSDGLASQIAGIKELPEYLRNKQASSTSMQSQTAPAVMPSFLPFHVYCMNHLTNLVIQHSVFENLCF